MAGFDPRSRAVWRFGIPSDLRSHFYDRPLVVVYDAQKPQHYLLARKKLTDICPPHRNQTKMLDVERTNCVWYALTREEAAKFMALDRHIESLFKAMSTGGTDYEASAAIYLRQVLDHGLYLLAVDPPIGKGTRDNPLSLNTLDEDLQSALDNTQNLQFHLGVKFEANFFESINDTDAVDPKGRFPPLVLSSDNTKACRQIYQRLAEIIAATDHINPGILEDIDPGHTLGKRRLKAIALAWAIREKQTEDLMSELGKRTGWATPTGESQMEEKDTESNWVGRNARDINTAEGIPLNRTGPSHKPGHTGRPSPNADEGAQILEDLDHAVGSGTATGSTEKNVTAKSLAPTGAQVTDGQKESMLDICKSMNRNLRLREPGRTLEAIRTLINAGNMTTLPQTSTKDKENTYCSSVLQAMQAAGNADVMRVYRNENAAHSWEDFCAQLERSREKLVQHMASGRQNGMGFGKASGSRSLI